MPILVSHCAVYTAFSLALTGHSHTSASEERKGIKPPLQRRTTEVQRVKGRKAQTS